MRSKFQKALLVTLLSAGVGMATAKAGSIVRLYYDNITGTAVTNLTLDPSFPNGSTGSEVLSTLLAGTVNQGDNYGSYIRGWIQAPTSGDYTFWVCSDDNSEFWLSTDDTSSNKKLIAREPVWNNPNDWDTTARRNAAAPENRSAPITLAGGNWYYLEILQKEGGGGDNISAGWQLPGGVKERPIPAKYLTPFSTSATLSQASITQDPVDVAVTEAQPADFSVNLDVVAPVTFQWLKNGNPIAGATLAYYSIPKTTLADNGTKYSVTVTKGGVSFTSAAATLTVAADAVAPTLVSALTQGNPNGLTVTFSEPVEKTSAENKANYAINNGVTVSTAVQTSPTTVKLTTSTIAEGRGYNLTVNGVKDLAQTPNVILANTQIGFLQVHGVITHRIYQGIGGGAVSDLTNSTAFKNKTPNTLRYISQTEGVNSYDDNYGQEIEGYLTPAVSGGYIFFVASDDNSNLFLSTDDKPANKQLIAREPNWNNNRDWTTTARRNATAPENKSAVIQLVAGRKYYVQGLQKEGGGGDNFAFTWQVPGAPDVQAGDPAIQSGFLNAYTGSGAVTITNDLADTTVNELATAVLTAWVDGTPPYSFQWMRNGTNLPGANSKTLSIKAAVTDNNATYSAVVSNSFSSVTTRTAKLTVVTDTTPPTIASAAGSDTFDKATIVFSEGVTAATAGNVANYAIDKGITVSSVTVVNPTTVTLKTSTQTPGTVYTVTVNGIKDLSAAGNTLAANSTKSFTAWVLARGYMKDQIWQGIGGVNLDAMTNLATYPDSPTISQIATKFEIVQDKYDNYGERLSGLIIPPETGDYLFYISADDHASLYLSSDNNPANKVLVAYEPNWNGARDWTTTARRNGENVSAPISLQAGKPYYVEAIMKEGGGGDNLAVTWKIPSRTTPIVRGEAAIAGTYLAAYVNPDGAVISVSQAPTDVTVDENSPSSFTAGFTGTSAIGTNVVITWEKAPAGSSTFAAIPGVVGPVFGYTFTKLSDNGAQFRAVGQIAGKTITSAAAKLTVNADKTAPKLVYAVSTDGASVSLYFSEPLDAASAGNKANYVLGGGATVSSATLGADGQSVVLATSALTAGTKYSLTITGVKDAAVVPQTIASTTVTVLAQTYSGNLSTIKTLTTKGKLAPGSKTEADRGFRMLGWQGTGQNNSTLATENWFAGLNGVNNLPPQFTNFIYNAVINFDNDGGQPGRVAGDIQFPYLTAGGVDNHGFKIVTYVALTAGIHRWGVNSDDGFIVYNSPAFAYKDPDAVVLGEFNGGRGASDTIFDFVVPEDGLYPIRMLYEEGGGGTNCEWWEIDPSVNDASLGPWNLINDSTNPLSPKAYVAVDGGVYNGGGSVPPPPPGKITVVKNGNGSLTLTWDAASLATLESSTTVNGTYAPVAGAGAGTATVTPTVNTYYRLKK